LIGCETPEVKADEESDCSEERLVVSSGGEERVVTSEAREAGVVVSTTGGEGIVVTLSGDAVEVSLTWPARDDDIILEVVIPGIRGQPVPSSSALGVSSSSQQPNCVLVHCSGIGIGVMTIELHIP
jgi:predicted short-subunit dehydrogenase-like oxidoreductase (DUF2520 family)